MSNDATLSVLLVDDEAPARGRMRDLLADIALDIPNTVVAEAANGLLALAETQTRKVDVVLVDIRMPQMDGIELARHLAQLEMPPAVIFVTAYDSYAVQAFELNAIDYLVKPVRAQRLVDALQKARQTLSQRTPGATQALAQNLAKIQQGERTHLSCHERGRLLLIPVPEVIYLKADLKYVTARTAGREFLLDESLTHLEQEFSERFIRVHRSVLVAKDAISGFEKGGDEDSDAQWQVLLRDVSERLPVSRRQWSLVKSYAKQLST